MLQKATKPFIDTHYIYTCDIFMMSRVLRHLDKHILSSRQSNIS